MQFHKWMQHCLWNNLPFWSMSVLLTNNRTNLNTLTLLATNETQLKIGVPNRWNLRVPCLQIICSDTTHRKCTMILVSVGPIGPVLDFWYSPMPFLKPSAEPWDFTNIRIPARTGVLLNQKDHLSNITHIRIPMTANHSSNSLGKSQNE